MKNKVVADLLLLFSFLFLFYPTSYALVDFKVVLIYISIVAICIFLQKKFCLKSWISEKNYIFIILLLAVLTRLVMVFLFNNKLVQIGEFSTMLEAAQNNIFQGVLYQIFAEDIIYPKILSFIFTIFSSSQYIALLTNAFITIITSLFVYKNASIILDDKKSAFYSALIYVLWPANILYTGIVTPMHLCSLFLMISIFLFLKLIKNDFYKNKKHLLLIISLLLGCLIGISYFLENISYIIVIALLIYLIIELIKSLKKMHIKEFLINNNIGLKFASFLLILISSFSTITFIFNKIEKDYIDSNLLKDTSVCYMTVGLTDSGPYSTSSFQTCFDSINENSSNLDAANTQMSNNLKNFWQNKSIVELSSFLDLKAKNIHGSDTRKIEYITESMSQDGDRFLENLLTNIFTKINNIYYIIVVFLGALGLIYLNKKKNIYLFIGYLIVYLASIVTLIFAKNSETMYLVQSLMCINAVAGYFSIKDILERVINPQKDKTKKLDYKCLFYLGLFLLLFIFLNIFISSVMLIFGFDIATCYFYISLILSIIITCYFLKRSKILNIKNVLVSIILPICLIFSTMAINGKIFDSTWDGNMYHKLGIGSLMHGWNPLEENVEDYDSKLDRPKDLQEWSYLWLNHYPMASYLFGANVGMVTNNVESGKSINILSMVILFCFCLSLMLYKKKDKLFSLLFSLIVVSCTSIVSQIVTNFIDGLVFLYLFMLMYYFFASEEEKYMSKLELLITYFMVLVILINIKFSSFAYAGLFCLGYYIWYIIRLIKKKYDKKHFIKFTITSALAVIVAVFIVGLSSYPSNLLEKGHPFYPIFGEGKKEIMAQETLQHLQDASPVEKFLVSTFSEATNQSRASGEVAQLKIPFSVKQRELDFAKTFDLRISGNGLLFSGIIVVSFLVFITLIFKEYKNDKNNFMLIIIPIAITIIMIFVMEDIWWARYFPQIHFIVFAALLLLKKYQIFNKDWLLNFLIIVILLNNLMFLIGNLDDAVMDTGYMNEQTKMLKSTWAPEDCKMKVYSLMFPGGYFNIEQELPEYDIVYTSKTLERDYDFVLNNGYAAGICMEENK